MSPPQRICTAEATGGMSMGMVWRIQCDADDGNHGATDVRSFELAKTGCPWCRIGSLADIGVGDNAEPASA